MVPVVFLLLLYATSVLCETCPLPEDIKPCSCMRSWFGTSMISIRCIGPMESNDDVERVFTNLKGKKIDDVLLSNIVVDRLPLTLFQGLSVKRLFIRNCEFQSQLEKDGGKPFVGLEDSLNELEIEDCFRYDHPFPRLNLSHLKHLTSLYLGGNSIPEIGNDWFENGPFSLRELAIESCELGVLGDKAFATLKDLEWLSLPNNRLTTIKRSMLSNPANELLELILRDNSIAELPEDIFTGMPALIDVDITENKIRTFPAATWSPVWEQLEKLFFDENPLECDSHLEWAFNIKKPDFMDGDCMYPENVEGLSLSRFIDRNRKTQNSG